MRFCFQKITSVVFCNEMTEDGCYVIILLENNAEKRDEMSRTKLIRSTGVIGSATTLSRVLGFIRDILFARFFGTGVFAQAFVVAFRLPNMLRDMVGEGATDAAIVPILSEYHHLRTKEEYWQVARIILNLMLSVLVLLSVAGVLFAPALVRFIAPGFLTDPEKFRTTVFLTRLLFPYILFLGMVAYSKGVLNSLDFFATPAFAPVVLNATMILALILLCPLIGVEGLVVGVLVGGLFEVLMQLRPLRKRGFVFGKVFKLKHPVVKRIGKLLLPRAMGTAVYQLSVLIDTVLASLAWVVGKGGVAALYYSNRLVQLPLAIFGISLATAALPRMSKEAASKDMESLKRTVAFALKSVFFIMLPASVGLMVLGNDIVRILFERGAFTAYSTAITFDALFYYSIGLFAYAGIKIMVSTYYSMGDTLTPVKTASVCLLMNIALNLLLMWPLKIGGLALATSIAAVTNFLILYIVFRRRVGDPGTFNISVSLAKMVLAAFLMGSVTVLMRSRMDLETGRTLFIGMRLTAIIISSMTVYILTALVLKVEQVHKAFGIFLEKVRS